MEILLLWAVFGFVGMLIGTRKGMSQAKAFLAGMLLGPFSLLMAFVSSEKKKCPACAEFVQKDAKVCRYCKHDLTTTKAI